MEEILYTPLIVIHVAACLFLVLMVLLQPGKSGGLGAFTGSGAQQVFGGRGAGNILTRSTWVTATIFFLTAVSLAFLSSSSDEALAKRTPDIGLIQDQKSVPSSLPAPLGPPSSAVPTPPPVEEPAAPPATTSEQIPPVPSAAPAAPVSAKPAPAAPAPAAPKPAVPAAPKPAVPAAPKPATPTEDPYG